MKRIWNVILLTLAVNFLAVAGGIGYLRSTGRIDREKVLAIRQILFPPVTQPSAPDGEKTNGPTTQPLVRLEELLDRESAQTASGQVEAIQRSFDTQLAQLDRRARELNDLQRQVDQAKAQTARDRAALVDEQKVLDAQKTQAAVLAGDKGFQDSLALYGAMPSKQVKSIFMKLDENTVTQYLQAMPPRSASRIIKEFKTPEESQFIQKILERMRQAQASSKE
ncbi:MAG: hypothetical protein ACREJC_03410 [Tepidisphaeraceae bacterium]